MTVLVLLSIAQFVAPPPLAPAPTYQDAELKGAQIEQLKAQAAAIRAQTRQRSLQSAQSLHIDGSANRDSGSARGFGADQSLTQMQTYGAFNGRAWRRMDDISQAMFMRGMFEGLAREVPAKLPNYSSSLLTEVEFRRAIDRFYEHPENLLIPVIDSARVVSMTTAGIPQSQIDDQLSGMRRVAAAAPERSAK